MQDASCVTMDEATVSECEGVEADDADDGDVLDGAQESDASVTDVVDASVKHSAAAAIRTHHTCIRQWQRARCRSC